MNRTFLDTGYLIALEISDDQHHKKAQEHWSRFKKQDPYLVTTSYVFDEITTFFNSLANHSKAVQIGQSLLRSPSIEFIHIDRAMLSKTFSRT